MKQLFRVAVAVVAFSSGATAVAAEDRQARQAQLDAACEEARQRQIAIDKPPLIEECVQQGKSQADCEATYRNYGGRSGARAPLYYDLPPCEEAFDYQHSQRRGG